MYSFVKQNYYSVPISNMFVVEVVANTEINYLNIIDTEFVIDFIKYKVITIMTDIPTQKVFALCQELPEQEI